MLSNNVRSYFRCTCRDRTSSLFCGNVDLVFPFSLNVRQNEKTNFMGALDAYDLNLANQDSVTRLLPGLQTKGSAY